MTRCTLDKNLLYLLLLIPLFFMLRQKSPDPVPTWGYEPKGIQINYNADEMLNMYNGRPHTLVLVVYQMSDAAVFKDLAKTADGLKKLLLVERFDPGVVGMDKMIVQPGEKKTMDIDRVEHAQWIGIVAGYYKLVPGGVNYTAEIQYGIIKEGRFRKKKVAIIKHMHVILNLGPNGIHKADTQ